MNQRKRLGTILTFLIAAAMLNGCTADPGPTDLQKPPAAADALPADITASTRDTFDEDSVRSAGSAEGVQVWIAKGKTSPVCLIAYETASKWVSACGEIGVAGSFPSYKIATTSDNQVDKTGGTKIGSNVLLYTE